MCPAGNSSQAAASSCPIACGIGEYSSRVTNGVCTPCPGGSFGNSTSQDVCSPCPALSHQPQPGQSDCIVCGAGTTSNEGQEVCHGCPAGQYGTAAMNGGCAPCAVGTYTASAGHTMCEACEAGKQAQRGSSECSLCTPGLTPNAAGTGCDECGVGKYSNGGPCLPCSAETYNPDTSASACVSCEPGKFQLGEGAVECSQCEDDDRFHEGCVYWRRAAGYDAISTTTAAVIASGISFYAHNGRSIKFIKPKLTFFIVCVVAVAGLSCAIAGIVTGEHAVKDYKENGYKVDGTSVVSKSQTADNLVVAGSTLSVAAWLGITWIMWMM